MNILLLKGYNNYFNRILKKEDTIAAYKAAVVSGNILNYYELASVNFNPNDGVTTELIVGKGDLVWDHPESEEREGHYAPDYCIAYNNNGIHSRWFVLECERTRDGQYRVALKRDLLADYYFETIQAPCFVEKGTILSTNDPLVFNAEGMSFNQIKQNQTILKDRTGLAWLVGYLKKEIPTSGLNPITYNFPTTSDYDYTSSDLDWDDCITYYDIKGQKLTGTGTKKAAGLDKDASKFYMRVYFKSSRGVNGVNYLGNWNQRLTWNLTTATVSNTSDDHIDWMGLNSCAIDINSDPNNKFIRTADVKQWCQDWINYVNGQAAYATSCWNNLVTDVLSTEAGQDKRFVDVDLKNKFSGKRILRGGKVYELTIGYAEHTYTHYYTGNDTIFSTFCSSLDEYRQYDYSPTQGPVMFNNGFNTDNMDKKKGRFDLVAREYSIVAREVILDGSISFSFPSEANRNTCKGAQYDMFAMPVTAAGLGFAVDGDDWHDTNFYYEEEVNSETVQHNITANAMSKTQLLLAQLICTQLGTSSGGYVYDLQLLPYNPMEFVFFEGSNYTTHNFAEGSINQCYLNKMDDKDYSVIKNGAGDMLGLIFWPKEPMFTRDISLTLPNNYVSYDTYTIKNPQLKYNNQTVDGRPLYRMEFPFEVTDGTWDIGPNINNPNSNITLPTAVVPEYLSVYVGSNKHPILLITSDYLDHHPTAGQIVTLPQMEISLLAHWVFPDTPERLKIRNECEFQRIVSPNYNGMFEFKKCKMLDGVHNINIDCLYKPYSPYIKLNPDFSYLYGRDYNDSTGLILSGDFSLPLVTDAFREYELQNKNYQAIFARQIQNLDVNNQIAAEQQQFQGIVGSLTGTLAGGVGGALAGAKAGPYGAIAGAVAGAGIGLGTSVIGAVKDRDWLERAQSEARSNAIDQYKYQLGNVRALPQSISKSSPLTYNNTVWPILEEYDCTEEEKEVLRQKLKYDGMTIMKVATLNDYLEEGGYLKGKLIRLPITDDFHVADAIYKEVDRGFYKGE